MVSAISKGRMGNFLWVNMVAYAYSLKHDLDFHIQDRSLAEQWPLHFQHLKNTDWDESLETVYINDNQHNYTKLPFKEDWRNKNIIIGTEDISTGYFQSYLYIKDFIEEIKYHFDLEKKINTGTVGCHLRFGDYRDLKEYHPPVNVNYIYNAVSELIREGYSEFIIYSDEPDYAREQVEQALFGINNIEITFMVGFDPLEDFESFMNCESNIVSNSSFSVLSALLNGGVNQIVMCPHEDNFYGPKNKHLNPSTIMPPYWRRIKY